MHGVAPRILLVEDHQVNEQVLTLFLHRMGCEVETAHDGEEALARAVEAWDLILMDSGLPRMDGFETTRAIRALTGPCAAVPIVAVTAYASSEHEARCFEAGMNGWLPKPVDAGELASVLELHLGWPARTRMAGDGTIDATVVQHLTALGEPDDPSFFPRLVSSFRAAGEQTLSGVRATLKSGDLVKLRALMHRLRGSAATIGAMRLSRACERWMRTGVPVAADLRSLQAELDQACAALDEVVARGAGFRTPR